MKLNLWIVLAGCLLSLVSQAEVRCSCTPDPYSKQYIGDVRQKHLIGYSIHWTCDYQCTVYDHQGYGQDRLIRTDAVPRAEFFQRFFGEEDGREGICEGMVYEPEMNYEKMRTIYMWKDRLQSFNPARSKSATLKAWAGKNGCDKGNLFYEY